MTLSSSSTFMHRLNGGNNIKAERKCRRRLVPPEPRIFLTFHLSASLAHIKSTDDWNAKMVWVVKLLKSPPTLILSFHKSDPLCCYYVSPSHMRGEMEKKGSIGWKPIFASDGRYVKVEPLWWFSFLRYTRISSSWSDGLRRNRRRCRVFFYRPYMENFLGKWTFFSLSYMYVHSNAIRYFHLHHFCGG